MLLDRKRINKWSKRIALALAIVFGLSFVLLGVGSGTGVNWSDLWTSLSGGTSNSATGAPADKIKGYQAQLATDPNNYDALIGIATQYQLLQMLPEAATYYERAIKIKPDQTDPQIKLVAIYLDPSVADNQSAIRVLNQLTTLQPTNAQAFLQLGIAQRNVGNTNAAILAWNRYIVLDPNSDMAKTVAAQIAQLTSAASTTTTAAGGATGTTSGATPTTLPATTPSS